jgi:hypothetical protein
MFACLDPLHAQFTAARKKFKFRHFFKFDVFDLLNVAGL